MSKPNLSDISAMCIDHLEQQGFILKGEKTDTLNGTSLINVLIGENSAGKSRLLRTILTSSVSHIDIRSDLKKRIELTVVKNMKPRYQGDDRPFHASAINEALKKMIHPPFDSELERWVQTTMDEHLESQRGYALGSDVSEAMLQALGKHLVQDLSILTRSCHSASALLEKREYVPILRGLRPLDPRSDLFKERTNSDYFDDKKKDNEYEIFTGYSLYSDLMHSLLGLEEERESVKQFENYLSEHFFEGKPITLIPKKDREGVKKSNDVVYVKIGEEPMRPIYELGDGIQAIIALTVNPFLIQEPTVFFIEEPEQHLHAGMQRALIQAFRACPQHKYFFTTQSNHFIDLSLESDDLSLFSVKKVLDEENNSKAEVTNQKDRSDILKNLGVLASSVLLANCSIWVEGITDKLYLRVYLQRFLEDLKIKAESSTCSPEEQKELICRHQKLSSFNENLHYVFVEYQGSNITHWNFSESAEDSTDTPARMLSKDVFLLADQDIKTKGTRVAYLKEALGENFCLLERKEIENYIPQNVILETANERWNSFNGKDDSSFDPSSIDDNAFKLKTIGIGTKLEKAVTRSRSVKPERKFFEDKSGTIKDKVKFCETACKLMKSKDVEWSLTPELEKLCDQIWTFVEKNNQISLGGYRF